MALSAAQAAAAVGMTKAGIIRAIHTGKLSATRNENNEFVIDPAELFRVYQPVATGVKSDDEVADKLPSDQSGSLQEKVLLLERIINDKDDVISDLRARLDAEAEERRRLSLILTESRSAPAPASVPTEPAPQPRSWWARMLGR